MFIEKVHPHKADYHGDVRTLVTGLSFQCPDDWKSIIESLDSQSNLTLKKELDNPHDKYAKHILEKGELDMCLRRTIVLFICLWATNLSNVKS